MFFCLNIQKRSLTNRFCLLVPESKSLEQLGNQCMQFKIMLERHFIREDIQEKISSYFPRVIVERVEVTSNNDQNSILVTIKYYVTNTDINDTLELSFV